MGVAIHTDVAETASSPGHSHLFKRWEWPGDEANTDVLVLLISLHFERAWNFCGIPLCTRNPRSRGTSTHARCTGGALTLALYSRCPRYFDLKIINIMHDLASSPASLASPAPSLAEEGVGDARLPAF